VKIETKNANPEIKLTRVDEVEVPNLSKPVKAAKTVKEKEKPADVIGASAKTERNVPKKDTPTISRTR
jgi:hypothetical protein